MRSRLLVRDLPAHVGRQFNRLEHVQLHGKHSRERRARREPKVTHLEVVKVDVECHEGKRRGPRKENDARTRAHEDEGEVLPEHHHTEEPHLVSDIVVVGGWWWCRYWRLGVC